MLDAFGIVQILPSIWYPPQMPMMGIPCRASLTTAVSIPFCRIHKRSAMVFFVPAE
jgi:hypothetical protein